MRISLSVATLCVCFARSAFASQTNAIVPAYGYPEENGTAFQVLYDTVSRLQNNLTFEIIVNVNSGPGSSALPDKNWNAAIQQLRSYNNTILLGYISTKYSQSVNSSAQVLQDVVTYAQWGPLSQGTLALDGIFFDEARQEAAFAPVYKTFADLARAQTWRNASNPAFIVLNPGTRCDLAYYDLPVNRIVNQEVPATQFDAARINAVSGAPKAVMSQIITNVTTSNFTYTADKLTAERIGSAYLTSEDATNPSVGYNTFGPDFGAAMDALVQGNLLAAKDSSPARFAASLGFVGMSAMLASALALI